MPGIITAVAAAIAISTSTTSTDDEFEKCKVIKDGKKTSHQDQ